MMSLEEEHKFLCRLLLQAVVSGDEVTLRLVRSRLCEIGFLRAARVGLATMGVTTL